MKDRFCQQWSKLRGDSNHHLEPGTKLLKPTICVVPQIQAAGIEPALMVVTIANIPGTMRCHKAKMSRLYDMVAGFPPAVQLPHWSALEHTLYGQSLLLAPVGMQACSYLTTCGPQAWSFLNPAPMYSKNSVADPYQGVWIGWGTPRMQASYI